MIASKAKIGSGILLLLEDVEEYCRLARLRADAGDSSAAHDYACWACDLIRALLSSPNLELKTGVLGELYRVLLRFCAWWLGELSLALQLDDMARRLRTVEEQAAQVSDLLRKIVAA